MAIAIIRRAVLTSNVATFEVEAAEPFQLGETVTVTGCTTGTFNATLTTTSAGLIQVNPPGTSGYSENWSGFSAGLTHANIAIESEPTTAVVTTGFGTSTSTPNVEFE